MWGVNKPDTPKLVPSPFVPSKEIPKPSVVEFSTAIPVKFGPATVTLFPVVLEVTATELVPSISILTLSKVEPKEPDVFDFRPITPLLVLVSTPTW